MLVTTTMGVGMMVLGITFDGHETLVEVLAPALIHERGSWALEMET